MLIYLILLALEIILSSKVYILLLFISVDGLLLLVVVVISELRLNFFVFEYIGLLYSLCNLCNFSKFLSLSVCLLYPLFNRLSDLASN